MDNDLMNGILDSDLALLGQDDDAGANRLPFPAAYAFWANGAPAMKQLGGVDYFGGWRLPEKGLLEVCPTPPAFLKRAEFDAGQEVKVSYTARTLHVAPFAARRWWTDKNTKTRYGEPAKGRSPSIQILGALQISKEGANVPVVLNLDGWQVTYYQDALKAWRDAITKHIRDLTAQRVDVFAFWLTFGTHGDKPETRRVGQGNVTKDINPVTAVLPAEWDAARLKARFVGVENLRQFAAWKQQAAPWLDHYKHASIAQENTPAPAPDWPPSDEAF
ncbi:MAG: hypothetical protein E6Q97_30190 [Desulfurellales bacterium]|nr:MAG: hypothetical protein E6Q97_30190 [Desulfurellales bacterium]